MKYDREQMVAAYQLAPPEAPPDQALRAFAILAGAAAVQAARFSDAADLGRGLPQELRDSWGAISSVLLEAADRATSAEPAEWCRDLSYVDAVVRLDAARLRALRERGGME